MQLLVESEDTSYVLCTLQWGQLNQYQADIAFTDQSIKLHVKGSGELHVCGTFSIDNFMDEDDDGEEFGSDELMGDYSSGSEGSDAEHPAFAGTKRIEVLGDDEDDDDDDDDDDDESDTKPKAAIAGGKGPAGGAPARPAAPQQGGNKPQQQQQQGGQKASDSCVCAVVCLLNRGF